MHLCREALADIGARRAQIESEGTGIALVHMSSPEAFGAFAKAYGLEDLPAVSDPTGRLYRGSFAARNCRATVRLECLETRHERFAGRPSRGMAGR